MTQTVGVFAPLQQSNAYQPPVCPATQRAMASVRNPGFFTGGAYVAPSGRPRYVSGYQGYKFYNPSEGGGYQGERFYNPCGTEHNPCGGGTGYEENPPWPGSVAPMPVDAGPWPGSRHQSHPVGRPWPGSVRAPNPMDEGMMVAEKTVLIKHPRTHKTHKVSVVSVRNMAPGVGEVVVDDQYAMLWDIDNNRPLISSVQGCPRGYRLYGGRCFRKVRSTNPKGCKTDADCPQEPCATSCAQYVNGVYDPQCVIIDPLCTAATFSAAPLPTQPSRFPPGTITSSSPQGTKPPSQPGPGGTLSAAPGAVPHQVMAQVIAARFPGARMAPSNNPQCVAVEMPEDNGGTSQWLCCGTWNDDGTLEVICRRAEIQVPDDPRLAPHPALASAAASIREENPRHPVYLNRWSLPWQYPWTYTHNPRTLQWGYVHPRHGYQTPWSGWGGWYPGYQGRSYYDERAACERVEETQSCPTGTVVERDREGNKMCCEQDGPNPWYPSTTYPYYPMWWCPGCGNYPRQHHRSHRGHGAHGGPRGGAGGGGGGVVGRGGGMIRTGGGASGTAMGGGATGGGGAIGSGGGGISTGGGASNPATVEEIQEVVEEMVENPRTGMQSTPVQPWDLAGPCPPGSFRMGGVCQTPGPAPTPPTLPDPPPPPSPKPGTGKPVEIPIGFPEPQAPQQPAVRPMPVQQVMPSAPPMQRPMQRPASTRTQAPRAQVAMRGMVRR